MDYGNAVSLWFTVTVNSWYGSLAPSAAILGADAICQAHLGEAHIWIFGYIDYQDVFGRAHKNRFAYRLPFDGDETENFRPDGPDSYHEYT